MQETTDALANVVVRVVERLERPPRLQTTLEGELGVELRFFDLLQAAVGVVNEHDLFCVQQPLREHE